MVMQSNRCGRSLLSLVFALMLLLGACSGEEGGGDDGSTSGSDDGSDTSGISGLTNADCRQYVEAFRGLPEATNPGSLEGLQQSADILDEAADKVPSEIRADFRVIADAYRQFADALQGTNIDMSDPQSMAELSESDLAALEAASEAMNDPEIEEAGQRINQWLQENCT